MMATAFRSANEHQITKESLSEMLSGFQRDAGQRNGYDIYTVKRLGLSGAGRNLHAKAAETARQNTFRPLFMSLK
jgi:hypothetical protein